METRANYLLIGVSALAGIVLGLAFFVWLAKFQIDRQYDRYDVLFDDVSGLSRAADVRFSGLSVGQVVALDLARDGSGRVRVRIEVDADTPIREGATAQLQSQGVTGVSLVSLSAGDPSKPLLLDAAEDAVPVIIGQRSVVQSLTEDAPDLLTESIKLVKEFQGLVGRENQDRVAAILSNVEQASGAFETALSDFSSISRSIAEATGQISVFTTKLEPIAESVDSALGAAEGTMAAMTSAFDQAGMTLGNADTALKSLDGAVSGVDDLVRTDGAATLATLRSTVTRLDDLVDALGTEARTVLALYGDTATQATARLTELQSTIVGLDQAVDGATVALASVDEAATSFDTLVEGDGTELVSEARTTLASMQASFGAIETVATNDLPAIVSDIRQALVTVNGTIDRVSQDVTRFTGDLAPVAAEAGTAIEAATTTFRDASAALDRLQPAIASAERTLAAAEGAFTGAEQAIRDDVAPATADLRLAAERMTVAVEAISADLPAITAELKATLAAASATIGRIDGVVQQSAGPVGQFAAQGLPQLTRLTQEAQALVLRLDRIAAQLERDPARFLLSTPAPDFRR